MAAATGHYLTACCITYMAAETGQNGVQSAAASSLLYQADSKVRRAGARFAGLKITDPGTEPGSVVVSD